MVKPEMDEDQEQVITALVAATKGAACAIEQETISATEMECLFRVLICALKDTFN